CNLLFSSVILVSVEKLSVTVLYDDIAIIISPEHNIYSPEHNTLPICLKKAYLGVGLLRL
ncbi:hypothetical protein, partial [Escherichia coli]